MQRIPTDNFKSPVALSIFLVTTLLGVAIDLATKVWAFDALLVSMVELPDGRMEVASSRTCKFIPGWLHFHVTVNYGAVFGVGQGKAWLFLIVSVLAIGFLIYLFTTSGRQRFYQFLLGLLLAGVLGNMYDRIVHGHVRDMILALPGWEWPGTWVVPLINYPGPDRAVFPWIFNVADTLLCVGVTLLLIYTFFAQESRDKPQPTTTTSPASPE